MSLRKPFYAEHQILTGQYTPGNEYVYLNGDDYSGNYHVLPNGRTYSGPKQMPGSLELIEKRFSVGESTRKYNQINNVGVFQYVSPVVYQPTPSVDDYKTGYIFRYFVQKRNNPIYTNTEISSEQYNSINTTNSVGINGILWVGYMTKWWISRIKKDDGEKLNLAAIGKLAEKFIGVRYILKDPLELYRKL